MNKAAQAYFQTKVNTTDQGQLLLLLYDGALKFLQQAREKMLVKDYAAKGILISKVIDIINELTNTLNLEKGGSLAENLNNLYFLCTTRLLQANLKMSVEQLDNVASILSGLRSAYAEIIETPEARRASAQISAKLKVDASVTQRGAIQTKQTAAPTSLGKMQARNAYGAMQQRSYGAPVQNTVQSQTQPSTIEDNAEKLPAAPTVAPTVQQDQQVQPVQATQVQKSAAIPFTQSIKTAETQTEKINNVQPVQQMEEKSESPAAQKTGFGLNKLAYPKTFGK